MKYPTNPDRRRGSASAGENGRLRSPGPRRAKPPKIFILVEQKSDWHPYVYARAHLRNRKGYVYLTWREGKRVRTFYLGKAPRKSPTKPADIAVDVAGRDVTRASRVVGEKLRGSR